MTSPQLQQLTAALAELDGRERALRAELDALRGRMVEWTQAEYLRAQQYWDDYRRSVGVSPIMPQAVAPVSLVSTPVLAPASDVPRMAPQVQERFWTREGFASKAMAFAGAVVTLAGVVMLLVLAAKSGYFGPIPRMMSGAVLAAGLVGLGVRVQSRPGGRVGGIATAATGFAAAFFDVLALTVIYDKIPVAIGLALGLAIAGTGLVLARQWNSQPFAAGVVAAITVLAPILTGGFTVELAAFALVLLIASLPAQMGRDWPVLHAFRTVGVAVTLLLALRATHGGQPHALLVMAVLALLVTLVGSLWLLTGDDGDLTSSIMIGVAAAPVLYSALSFAVWPLGVLVPVGVAAVMGAVLLLVGGLPVHTRITMAAIGGLALMQASVEGTKEALLAVVLLTIALSFAAIGYQLQERISLVLGQIFGALGGLAYVAYVPPELLTDSNSAVREAGSLLIVASVLSVATVGMVMAAMHRVGWASPQSASLRGVLAGASMLYAGTAAVVLSGTALLGSNDGFLLGHGMATVSWMAVSVALLLAGLRHYRDQSWVTRTGFVLASMAVAKLFLFDLATLDGIARIGAFIVTGLLLLGGGTLYAREYATLAGKSEDQPY
ncbi:DUF2339 domain-containing protein [Mycobacterium sp. CBMA271]|uniref:DUF2339 domain-containing protein n=1 Tax=unclassified Mycobacteroides TaxID=2618759 RepID=UPI0012DE39D2|nr:MULTISPECIES: DUF2339 domain-containing protein [unclassified Mycobacteroides]MUM19106.1 hypothetical protein [Mycobacteroides sp. CBMA 326]MUM21520.1 DUF2339 domain-containing protein [Mycobacteroides sp. CBMA 271]